MWQPSVGPTSVGQETETHRGWKGTRDMRSAHFPMSTPAVSVKASIYILHMT